MKKLYSTIVALALAGCSTPEPSRIDEMSQIEFRSIQREAYWRETTQQLTSNNQDLAKAVRDLRGASPGAELSRVVQDLARLEVRSTLRDLALSSEIASVNSRSITADKKYALHARRQRARLEERAGEQIAKNSEGIARINSTLLPAGEVGRRLNAVEQRLTKVISGPSAPARLAASLNGNFAYLSVVQTNRTNVDYSKVERPIAYLSEADVASAVTQNLLPAGSMRFLSSNSSKLTNVTEANAASSLPHQLRLSHQSMSDAALLEQLVAANLVHNPDGTAFTSSSVIQYSGTQFQLYLGSRAAIAPLRLVQLPLMPVNIRRQRSDLQIEITRLESQPESESRNTLLGAYRTRYSRLAEGYKGFK